MKIALSLLVLLSAAPVLAVPVSVVVLDDKGKPVTGADVQLESFGKSPRGIVLSQTNEQGTATFDVEPLPNSPYGDFAARIFARKNGFAIADGHLGFKTPLRLTLSPPAKISGKVVDGEGKPIQGATVSFLSTQKNGDYSDMLIEGPLLAQMTTRSGADGSWQLEGVPPDTQVFVTVSSPGRVAVRTQILAGGDGQTILAPGAQIKGRLLGLDGKPLASISVDTQGSNNSPGASGSHTTTAADGTFTLDGLSSGTYNVMFQCDDEKPFVVAAFEGVNASVGTPLQLPDSRAVEGVMIGGRVLESQTKVPVVGTSIGIYGGVNPASSAQVSVALTDDKGQWKKRTLPGQSKIYLMGTPQEFKQEAGQQQQNIVIGKEGNLSVDFNLERLPKVTGRLLDEEGKAIEASFQLRHDTQTFWASSDKDGTLTAYGPTEGVWDIAFSNWGGDSGNAWEVVGPAHVTIAPGKPLEVRLRRLQSSTLELGVYDDDDVAIEGARINVNVTTGTGNGQSMRQVELISDKTGRARYEGLRADQSVEIASAKKSGYDTAPLPKIEHAGRAWTASVTLLKRRGRATGQIFGPNGEVALDALVSASGIDTRSDTTGHFEISPLPKGVVPVVAWQRNGFALGSSDQTRLDLKPQELEPTNPAKALTIINALFDQTEGTKYYWRDSLVFEVGTFSQLSLRLSENPGKGAMTTLIARFANDKSVTVEDWFSVLQKEKDTNARLYATSQWMKTSPALEATEESRKFLRSLQTDVAQAETQFKSDDKWMIAEGIFAVAAFAEKIGDIQAADALFERARAFTEKAYGTGGDRIYGNVGEIVAVSPRLLLKTAALLPTDNGQHFFLLSQAVPLLARNMGLEAVRPLLTKIQNAPVPKPDSEGDTISTESLWHEATIKSIKAAGKTSPGLALELAKALPLTTSYGGYDARDLALSEAAFFQPADVARELWRDSLLRLQPDKAMSFLARVLKRDEAFARDLYETVARNMDARQLPDPGAIWGGATASPAAFAFYEARFNPARARFRLERAFALSQNQPNGGVDVASYAKAMAIFDSARAVSWTASSAAPINDPTGNFQMRRRIAQWLVLSEDARQNATFSGPYSQDGDF